MSLGDSTEYRRNESKLTAREFPLNNIALSFISATKALYSASMASSGNESYYNVD